MFHSLRLALPFAFLALPVQVLAWNDFGHMVVADIASRVITPATNDKIQALLKIGGTEKTREMMTAACWADDTRTRENGPWHYINYHFRSDGKPTNLGPAEENVVWAIRRFSSTLRNANAPEAERADALRYLLHYVGDIHNPLHCVARDTEAFPNGDRGGNDFKIQPYPGLRPEPRNLHFLWDMGAGEFPEIERPLTKAGREAIGEAAELALKLNPERQLASLLLITDPDAWAKEGLELAKAKVYKLDENAVPPKAYVETVRKEALRRVTLAGYRLGRLLNRLLDPGGQS